MNFKRIYMRFFEFATELILDYVYESNLFEKARYKSELESIITDLGHLIIVKLIILYLCDDTVNKIELVIEIDDMINHTKTLRGIENISEDECYKWLLLDNFDTYEKMENYRNYCLYEKCNMELDLETYEKIKNIINKLSKDVLYNKFISIGDYNE